MESLSAEIIDLCADIHRAEYRRAPAAEKGRSTANRYQVVVHASAESLAEHGFIDPADPTQMEDGSVLAQEDGALHHRRFGCIGTVSTGMNSVSGSSRRSEAR